MKLELDEFKTGFRNIMLKVVFQSDSNFWIDKKKGIATWVPRWEELEKILKALQVIDSGNKKIREKNG